MGEGKGEKGKGWRREGGKVAEGMGGTGQDMGWDRKGRERERRKGREREQRGYIPKLLFLAPPLIDGKAYARPFSVLLQNRFLVLVLPNLNRSG